MSLLAAIETWHQGQRDAFETLESFPITLPFANQWSVHSWFVVVYELPVCFVNSCFWQTLRDGSAKSSIARPELVWRKFAPPPCSGRFESGENGRAGQRGTASRKPSSRPKESFVSMAARRGLPAADDEAGQSCLRNHFFPAWIVSTVRTRMGELAPRLIIGVPRLNRRHILGNFCFES